MRDGGDGYLYLEHGDIMDRNDEIMDDYIEWLSRDQMSEFFIGLSNRSHGVSIDLRTISSSNKYTQNFPRRRKKPRKRVIG